MQPEEARNNVVAATWLAVRKEPGANEQETAIAVSAALTDEERKLLSTMVVERVIRAIVAAQASVSNVVV